jgi:hypothetical protein
VVLIKEIALNIYIYLFLLFGLVFGLSTFSYMHLFSEGPHKADSPEDGSTLGGRVLWAMVLTGLNSARILAKRKRQTVGANH